jgi:chromosome segregation ATPase
MSNNDKELVERQIRYKLEQLFTRLECALNDIKIERDEIAAERKKYAHEIEKYKTKNERLDKKCKTMLVYKDRCLKAESQMQLLQRQLDREHQQTQTRHEQQLMQIRENLRETNAFASENTAKILSDFKSQ